MRSKRHGGWAAAQDWRAALGIEHTDHVALMGGGGKTTTMWSMARELASAGPTIVTSTTKAGELPADIATVAWAGELPSHELHVLIEKAFAGSKLVALTSGARGGRLEGVSPIVVDEVFLRCGASYIVNEADGARMKPFKAPGAQEPVTPSTTTLAVIVVGADAVGARIDDKHLHRPEEIARITGASPGATLTAEHVAAIVQAYLRKLDFLEDQRAAVLINKADAGPDQPGVAELAAALAPLKLDAIAAASQAAKLQLWKAL